MVHTEQKPHECDVCGKLFVQINNLYRHRAKHHADSERMYVCNVCNERFSVKKFLTEHYKMHAMDCDLCDQIFHDAKEYKLHRIAHSYDSDRREVIED